MAAMFCIAAPLASQDALSPHRFSQPPVVDGQVTDEEWAGVAVLPLVNLYPSFGSPLTERTEIRIGYDADALYASIRAWDTEPSRIRASTLQRDRWETDDEFVVILDTFADGQNGAMFLVTPAGVRVDNQLTHDTEPGRGAWLNRDWNVPWDAAAARQPDGWSAEMRVPFSSLRFRGDSDRVTMRVKSYRYIPRKSENQMFPATRPDAGANPHFKPSAGQVVVFEGIAPTTPVYVQPYLAATTASRGTGRRDWNIGTDVKWSLSQGLTLDLVANADFAQVEVDQPQVNLTRFPLRFPEQRPFFLERSGLFAVGLGGDDTLFHSRRVGLSAAGLPVPLHAGVRLAGRLRDWDVGVLTAQEGGAEAHNTTVVRLQRPLVAGPSVGLTATTRVGANATGAAAIDASWARGRQLATGVWAVASGRDQWLEQSRGMLRWQRDGESGLSANGEYRFTGRGFEPSAGFVRVLNAHEASASVRQIWRPDAAVVRRIGWDLSGSARWRRAAETGGPTAGLEEARLFAGGNAEWRSGIFTSAVIEVGNDDVAEPFVVTQPIVVNPGQYDTVAGRVVVGTPAGRALQVTARTEFGGWYGGRRWRWRVEPVWTPNAYLQAWATYDGTRIDRRVDGTGRLDVVVLGARGALNPHWFADVTANRMLDGQWYGQVRGRWHRGEGHDAWLVWEFGRPDRARALSMKYTRLFTVARRSR